jgi:autotransporter-associated beta strand protein
MKLPLRDWIETLASRGFTLRKKAVSAQRCARQTLRFERLEGRQLMSTTLQWDPTGSQGASLGGAGNFDTTTAAWFNSVTSTDVVWNNSNGDTAVFAGAPGTVTLTPGIAAGEVDFSTTGYTLSGGSLAISGSGTIDVAAGLTDTIGSTLNGTNGLTKTSDGALLLSGTPAYTGTTSILAGRLTLADETLASSSVDIGSGATLEYNITTGTVVQASTTLSGTGTLQKTGGGTLTFGGLGTVNWDFGSGALIDVEAGTLVGGSYIQDVWTSDLASLNIASGATFNGVEANVQVDALTGSGTFAGGYPGAGYTADTIGVDNDSGTFSGTIQDAYEPLNLIKAGSGTEFLAGTSAYSGSTSVTGGRLTLEGVTLASSSIDVSSGAMLEYNITTGTVVQASTTLSGSGTLEKTGDGELIFGGLGTVNWDFGSGALIDVEAGMLVGGSYIQDVWASDLAALNIASGATFNGVEANVQVDALTGDGTFAGGYPGAGYTADTIGVDNGSGTFSGSIQDAYAPLNLIKAGSGTETFTGANTYTGSTTISAGTLQLGDDTSSNGSVSGDIIDNAALVFDNPTDQTYWGSISGTGTVEKDGDGTLIFSGPNDYMGDTTINAGTLEVDTFIMPSAVTLNEGTLQGTGGTGAVTNNGGTYVANYYYVSLIDTSLQRGDTAATDIGSASISVSLSDAIYAMSAAQAVFQVVSGSATTIDTGDTHPISTAAIAGADGHPAFIYSPNGYNNDNNGAFQNIGQAIMFEDYTAHPGCDYDYNDGYFRVSVTAAPTIDALDDANNDTVINQLDEPIKDVGAGNVVLVSNEAVAGQTHTIAGHLDDVQLKLSAIDQVMSSTRNWSGWNLTLTADDSTGAASSSIGIWSINGATQLDNGNGVANLNSYLAALPDTFDIGVSATATGTYELKFILKDAGGSIVATDQVRFTAVVTDAAATLTVTNMAPLTFTTQSNPDYQNILEHITLPSGYSTTSITFTDVRGGTIVDNHDGTWTYSPNNTDYNGAPWHPYNPYGGDPTGADGANGGASFTAVFSDANNNAYTVSVNLIAAHSGYLFAHDSPNGADANWVASGVQGTGGLLLSGGGSIPLLARQDFIGAANNGDIVIIGSWNPASGVSQQAEQAEVQSLARRYATQYGADHAVDVFDFITDGMGTLTADAQAVAKDIGGTGAGHEFIDKLQDAAAVWFVGGDQWPYVQLLQTDTGAAGVINNGYNAGTLVVGGTSAGLAILGNYVYTAEYTRGDTILTSQTVLNNFHTSQFYQTPNPSPNQNSPFAVANNVLQLSTLGGVVTETHFTDQDEDKSTDGNGNVTYSKDANGNPIYRLGRLISDMATVLLPQNSGGYGASSVFGLGVSQNTTLWIKTPPGGNAANATVIGQGYVYFATANTSNGNALPVVNPSGGGQPQATLTMSNVYVRWYNAAQGSLNFANAWNTDNNDNQYTTYSVHNGVLSRAGGSAPPFPPLS